MSKHLNFISYVNETDDEVIVTTPALEQEMIKEFFVDSDGRDLEDFERRETANFPGVQVTTKLVVQ
jgi:hypothetical protein